MSTPLQSPQPSKRAVIDELQTRAAEWARHVVHESRGKVPERARGDEIRFGKQGSLCAKVKGTRAGQWYDHEHGCGGGVLALYTYLVGGTEEDALTSAAKWLTDLGVSTTRHNVARRNENHSVELSKDDNERIAVANTHWATTSLPYQTATERYLASRGIRGVLPSAIRHADLTRWEAAKFGIKLGPGDVVGTLVCSATDSLGQVRAVQRIFLLNDVPVRSGGRKLKLTYGIMAGASVMLADPDETLILAEGPETALSILFATGIATWACLGTANFTKAPIPDRVRTVIIAVDIDPSWGGIAMALKAASYWARRGKLVRIAIPGLIEGDFNDVLTTLGSDQIRSDIDSAIKPLVRPSSGSIVVTRDGMAGIAIWAATGLDVLVKPKLKPDRDIPDDTPSIVALDHDDPWAPAAAENAFVRIFRAPTGRVRDLTPDILRIGVDYATPQHLTALPRLLPISSNRDSVLIGLPRSALPRNLVPNYDQTWLDHGISYDLYPLSGRTVVLLHRDDPGSRDWAARIAVECQEAGAKEVRVRHALPAKA